MIKINVITNNDRWSRLIKDPLNYVNRKVKKLNLKNKIFKKKIILCTLLLSSNQEIKKLNKKFRKKNKIYRRSIFPFS